MPGYTAFAAHRPPPKGKQGKSGKKAKGKRGKRRGGTVVAAKKTSPIGAAMAGMAAKDYMGAGPVGASGMMGGY